MFSGPQNRTLCEIGTLGLITEVEVEKENPRIDWTLDPRRWKKTQREEPQEMGGGNTGTSHEAPGA